MSEMNNVNFGFLLLYIVTIGWTLFAWWASGKYKPSEK